MSQYHQAADALKRYAVKYESLIAAAQALDAVGSLDQAAKEAQAQVKAAGAELIEVKADLVKAKADLTKAKGKSAEIVTDAENDAAARGMAASLAAQELVAAAKAKAQQITDKANQQADNMLAGAAGKLDGIAATRDVLQSELLALTDSILAKKIEADGIEARLAKAQAQIAKLLG